MRRSKKNRRKSNGVKKRVAPLRLTQTGMILFCLVLFAFLISRVPRLSLFAISRIDSDVEGAQSCGQRLKGCSLFTADMTGLYSCVKSKHPEFRGIEVRKVFPSSIKVCAVKRTPCAQLKRDGFYQVDREGVVLSGPQKDPYDNLVIVELGSYPNTVRTGTIIDDERLEIAFELEKALQESGLRDDFTIQTISASSVNSVAFFMDDVRIWMGEGNFKRKIFCLENLLAKKLNNSLDSLRYIDLRYATTGDNIYIGKKR